MTLQNINCVMLDVFTYKIRVYIYYKSIFTKILLVIKIDIL